MEQRRLIFADEHETVVHCVTSSLRASRLFLSPSKNVKKKNGLRLQIDIDTRARERVITLYIIITPCCNVCSF